MNPVPKLGLELIFISVWSALILQSSALPESLATETVKQEDPAVTRLRDYLRLKAVHPNPDYTSSIAWIKTQAEEVGLEYNIKEFDAPALFAIWLTWNGKDPSLPSIMLNSHIDVVPVYEEKWTHDPFGAEKDENGNIYGRGTQDMKGTAVQYLEAVRNLKSQGVVPLRNVHITFLPDEEAGGFKGMKPFVSSDEFKNLNVGFALDEGMVSPDDKLQLVWTERVVYQMEFVATGPSGHGSILHNNTAAEKIQRIINAMLGLRTKEKNRMEADNLTLGEVTTINLTVMKGGQQANVSPAELSVTFDIRVTPFWNLTYVDKLLEEVRNSAGSGVTINYIQKSHGFAETPLKPTNVWWTVFQNAAKELGIALIPSIHVAATDIKYLREQGIPAFGFTAIRNTPLLVHDHDEFLNEDRVLEGIKIYEQLLPKLFNLESTNDDTPGGMLLKESPNPKSELGIPQPSKAIRSERVNHVYALGMRPRDFLNKFESQYEV